MNFVVTVVLRLLRAEYLSVVKANPDCPFPHGLDCPFGTGVVPTREADVACDMVKYCPGRHGLAYPSCDEFAPLPMTCGSGRFLKRSRVPKQPHRSAGVQKHDRLAFA